MTAERAFRHPARFEEARKVAAFPELGNAQLYRSGAGLPVALVVTIALDEPGGRLLAVWHTGQATNLHLRQSLGGKRDDVAQNIGVGGFSTSERR